MSIALVSSSTGTTSAALSGCATGSLVIAVVVNNTGTAAPAVPVFATGFNTFTSILTESKSTIGTGGGSAFGVFYSYLTAAFTGNILASTNGTNICVYNFTGAAGTLDASNKAVYAIAGTPTVSLTTTVSGDLLMAFVLTTGGTEDGVGGVPANTGYSQINNVSVSNGIYFSDQWKTSGTVGSTAVTMGDAATTWQEIAVAFTGPATVGLHLLCCLGCGS
jgi:hypothetical protein